MCVCVCVCKKDQVLLRTFFWEKCSLEKNWTKKVPNLFTLIMSANNAKIPKEGQLITVS